MYILSVWESIELLELVLKQHFVEEKAAKGRYTENSVLRILDELNLPNNSEFLLKHANTDVSGDIAPKLKASYARTSNVNEKVAAFSKLVYEVSLGVRKNQDNYLNKKQLEALLSYIGKLEDISKYRNQPLFNAKFDIRNALADSYWEVFTWDYAISDSREKISGIRKSILHFKNLFRVQIDIYRNREEVYFIYKGDYKIIGNYLRLRFSPTASGETREEDFNFMLYVGRAIEFNLAMGQYRSIDCGSLMSGNVIIKRLEQGKNTNMKPIFTSKPKEEGIDAVIADFLSEKNKNHLKTPEKITSLGKLKEWYNEK